jgi:hypothetical protein
MLILKPHLIFTMTVVGISSPEWRVIVAFPPILLNRKPPSGSIDQQYAGQNDRAQEPKKQAFLA